MTAVIPTWNRRELLESLFASLNQQTRPPAEVIVIDNGSSDGAAEAAERFGARVLRMGRNAGFAPAVNRGVRESRTETVAVLNNDVQLAPDYLERLAADLAAPDVWFATGKIFDARDHSRIDGCWDALARSGCSWRAGAGRKDHALFSKPRRIAFSPATAVLYRREIFERVGFFEESFESYLEDVEFGLRCLLAGCGGWFNPAARAYHLGSGTLGEWHPDTVRRIARNQSWIAQRYLGLTGPVLAGQTLWGLVALRHGRFLPWLRGKLAALRRRKQRTLEAGELLRASEDEIRELQRAAGPDIYWRLYFWIVRGRG
jgi:GT2 family glycosyltransferase